MSKRMSAPVIGACLAIACLLPVGTPARAAGQISATTLPNIVVFYVDDVPPTDGRLWSNPALTPSIYDRFVEHGVHFSNSIGETPLCCPGRSGLLTGLHTHNHGVIANDARMFNPAEHIGLELKRQGYATMLVGKYLNRDDSLSATQWTAHGRGWTYLDVIKGINGDFFDYTVHTKTGDIRYRDIHSTQMTTERTIAHLRQTPASTPVFSVVSLFNLHGPNIPMPGFENDPRWGMCDQMPPWDPPNYNEADVSDKPSVIQALPLLPYPNGWPMTGYCREMLGVDWSVQRITDELATEGRLDNTLLVFTADNGMGWGEHRVGQSKSLPYTTPVPLYMSWPARWGSDPRTINDTVSNIDLAPTFCALAGCAMGPYSTGQTHADGTSLLPLLDAQVDNLGRDAVLESSWNGPKSWTAVRTTPSNPLGLWHYVEWADGERELYDLSIDPWELENRNGDPTLTDIQAALAARLAQLRAEGVEYQPDASVALAPGVWSPYKGDTLYADHVTSGQTLRLRRPTSGASIAFHVRITNDGGGVDSFNVTASLSGTASGSTDVPPAFEITALPAHQNFDLTVNITVDASARRRSTTIVILNIVSQSNPTRSDVLKLVGVR